MAGALTACSSDDFDGGHENGIPSIDDIVCKVTVDQETNNVTFSVDNPGCYPVWDIKITPATKTTDNNFTRFIATAGTYSYSVRLANRNGISAGTYEGEFTVDQTRYDFTPYQAALATAEGKEWRIYASKAKHMGCGPLFSDGMEWWSCAPNEKIDNTIYDDVITFTTDGRYIYDPGPNGYIFCNNAFKQLGVNITSGDYDAPVKRQETTYGFTVVNGDPAIAMESGAFFPYMSSDAVFNAPVYRIINGADFVKNGKVLELVADDAVNNISWHYLLVNGEDEAMEEEFDISQVDWVQTLSDGNIFKIFNQQQMDITYAYTDAGWAPVGSFDYSFADGVQHIGFPYYVPSWEEWHGFICLTNSDITVPDGVNYDFSISLIPTQDIGKIHVKVTPTPEEETCLLDKELTNLKAGELVQLQDGKFRAASTYNNMQIILSFQGVEAGTEVQVKDIILQQHAELPVDDGYYY